MEELYGIEDDAPKIQELGHVSTPEGRLLAFPNVFQHRVSPFQLRDPSQPGHRKILALFLVDPHVKILSTANVPPQQRSWWENEIRSGSGGRTEKLSDLPPELMEQVVNDVTDFPISLEEAKEVREELIEERRAFVEDSDKVIQAGQFSFCEH